METDNQMFFDYIFNYLKMLEDKIQVYEYENKEKLKFQLD